MTDSFAFAWLNLRRGDRLRALVALAGAMVAIFVVLLHLAFLRAVEDKAAQVYDLFAADVVLVSDRFQFLYNMPDFPLARLRQANAHPAVADLAAVNVGSSHWQAPVTDATSSILLIGIDPAPDFLRDAALRDQVALLQQSRRILMDRLSHPDVGVLETMQSGRMRGQTASVAGWFDLGMAMYADAGAVVSRSDYPLYTGEASDRIQLGLLRLKPGSDPAQVVEDLRALLPKDVRVMTMAALRAQEQDYFVRVKPLGVMMHLGLFIGLVVGTVALYQALSSQMETRIRDFAVLRAMGFASRFTYGVGAFQLLILGGLAFTLAWVGAIPTFALIARLTHLSMPTDLVLLGQAALLCLPMIATAAIPLLRAGRADPASLF